MSGEVVDESRESGGGPVGFVAAVAASAVSVGLLVISATVVAVDALRSGTGSGNLDVSFYLLAGGTLSGVTLAAYAAWRLLAPVGSAYRRGALSMVCAFATILLMLICIPLNQLFGRTGLLVLLGISGFAAAVSVRRARRLGAGV